MVSILRGGRHASPPVLIGFVVGERERGVSSLILRPGKISRDLVQDLAEPKGMLGGLTPGPGSQEPFWPERAQQLSRKPQYLNVQGGYGLAWRMSYRHFGPGLLILSSG